MKKFLASLFFCAVSTAFAGGPYVGGEMTNPVANAILADTGPRAAGGKFPAFTVCSTATAAFYLEYRDASNAANVVPAILFAVPANSCKDYLFPVSFDTLENERFRLRLRGVIAGIIQATIFD